MVQQIQERGQKNFYAAGRFVGPAGVRRAKFVGFPVGQGSFWLGADEDYLIAEITRWLHQCKLVAHARPGPVLAVIAQPSLLWRSTQFSTRQLRGRPRQTRIWSGRGEWPLSSDNEVWVWIKPGDSPVCS